MLKARTGQYFKMPNYSSPDGLVVVHAQHNLHLKKNKRVINVPENVTENQQK